MPFSQTKCRLSMYYIYLEIEERFGHQISRLIKVFFYFFIECVCNLCMTNNSYKYCRSIER